VKRGLADWARCAALAGALGLAPASLSAAEPERKPEPSWVKRIAPDFEVLRPSERERDAFTLLSDSRVRLDASRYERYERRVRRALTPSGVERLAELLVDFEPEHEKLVLHRIELRRGGQVLDQTRSARVRLVAQESELERRMYNGDVTAFIVLSDVRAGDVIDLSYSIVGNAPILGGRYAGDFELDGRDSVRQRHIEVSGQGDRPELHGKVLGAAPSGHSQREIGPAWADLQDLEPRPDEDRVPAAYAPAWLDVSEFGSWQEVATWAARLYPVLPPSRELAEQAAALAGQSSDPAEVALKILRFVQDDVRYLAINNEGHALSPHPPKMVLSQRFGDCKDKTYLLLHLLRARGIEALPMLVHSVEKTYLLSHEPSPYAFDHVILRATIAGKAHYLDATYAQQGGTLATQVAPDFGYGLVLSPDTTGLEAIPTTAASAPEERSETTVSVASDGAAALDVTTTFLRGRADDMRDELASKPLKDIGERYTNYYQSEFPDVEVAQPIEMTDERLDNRVTVREHYRVPKFWRDGERSLYTEATDGYLKQPHVVRRTRPLSLSFPVWIEDVFVVNLPFRSSVESRNDVSTDGIIKFSRDIHNTGAQLLTTFEYKSFAGTVPLEKMAEHLAALQRARDCNTVTFSDESADAVAAPARRPARTAPTSLKSLWVLGSLALALMLWPAGRSLGGLLRRRRIKRLQRAHQGETPAHPANVSSLKVAEAALTRLACDCGRELTEASVEWSSLRYHGAALQAGRVLCPACGEALRRYFKLEKTEP